MRTRTTGRSSASFSERDRAAREPISSEIGTRAAFRIRRPRDSDASGARKVARDREKTKKREKSATATRRLKRAPAAPSDRGPRESDIRYREKRRKSVGTRDKRKTREKSETGGVIRMRR